jgi:hypothetical protein
MRIAMRRIIAAAIALALAGPAAAFNLPFRAGQVTGSSGSSTLNQDAAIVTTESLSTAAGSTYTETFNSNAITPYSLVFVSVQNGTNSQGDVSLQRVTPGNSQVVITIVNRHASQAFNGSLIITILVFN